MKPKDRPEQELANVYLRKVVLSNFKRFRTFKLNLEPGLNILAGDNEVGKSTVMSALDLVLSGSRSRVDALGIESMLSKEAVMDFLSGPKIPSRLPELFVEVYLSDGQDPDLYGRCNSLHENAYGVRLSCSPSDQYSNEINQVLSAEFDNFPFEFYTIQFATFAGTPYQAFNKPLKSLLIDGAQIMRISRKENIRGYFTELTLPPRHVVLTRIGIARVKRHSPNRIFRI